MNQWTGAQKRKALWLALGAQRRGPPSVTQPLIQNQADRRGKQQIALSWAGCRQAALLDALHDVYLQGVHVRSLILALGAAEVGRLLGGASPLAGQGQVKGVMSWGKRIGTSGGGLLVCPLAQTAGKGQDRKC